MRTLILLIYLIVRLIVVGFAKLLGLSKADVIVSDLAPTRRIPRRPRRRR